MKQLGSALIFLLLLFSAVREVKAQASNGHLPQCSNTAPQAVIQVAAAPQGQNSSRRLAIAVAGVIIAAATATVPAVAAVVAAAVGHGIEKAFINEDVEFPGRGGAVGAAVGAVGGVSGLIIIVVVVVVCKCT